MNLTILSRYSRQGASSRLRTMQYLPYLQAAGFDVTLAPFFGDDYLGRLYSGQSTRSEVLRAYRRRLGQLREARNADLIWIEKEALPWMPWAIERAALPRHVPIVSDYDDAVFHRYDVHRRGLVRRLLGRKLDRLMAASTLVTPGNAYLADRAKAAGAGRVMVVPTVVDATAYRLRAPSSPAGRPLVIGWIGSPSTWGDYMVPMLPMLTQLADTSGARILAIGAPQAPCHPAVDIRRWSEETEVDQIREMDIGLMPLDDSPWSRGKCGYKLIQYMACGVPVIAAPVGVNVDIVEPGVNGFLASTEAEWRSAIATLQADPDLRARMGAAGRKKVEQHYSLQVWGPRVASAMAGLARRRQT